jgi:LPS sulfotransferase NodH
VFLRRRDRDAQAISTVRAGSPGRPDFDAIHRARLAVDADVAAWEQFFFINDLHPHRVLHEDLTVRPDQVVAGIARFLRVDLPAAAAQEETAAPPYQEIVDDVQRYRRERLARTARPRGPIPAAAAPVGATRTSPAPAPQRDGRGPEGALTPPGFVIAGTGRSGSGYIANVLQQAGIRCGHEQYYLPPGGRPISGLDGDSSWLAVPHLDRLTGPVLLQLRHPLDVIRSLVGIRMFTDPVHGAYQQFAFAHLPELTGLDDTIDAMRWYVEWNERAEAHARLVYRVEDVDAALLQEIAGAAGHRIGRAAAARAIAAVPSNFNTRPRAALEWDELPVGALRDRVQAFAHRHGYQVEVAPAAERVLSGR